MNDLITVLRSRLEAAVASVSYPRPGGGNVMPAVFVGGKPQNIEADNSNVPFVMLRVTGGTDDQSERLLTARILCAVWEEDMAAGIAAINDLTLTVLSLQRQRGFTPYKLMLPVKWSIGDEQGDHPHPFYFANIIYQFKGQPLADRQLI